MKWKIGNIEIKSKVVLAPMAGMTNPAYIKICEEMGVGYAITELISAEAIVRNNKKTFEMLNGINEINIPIGIQLFGAAPNTIAKAAKIINELYPKSFIDINMGCPVPKVALRSQAGAALLKDLDKIYDIVSEVVKSVPIPITVKIRSGWDRKSINAVEVAKICEKAGASAICVHPRTRSQGYEGLSDWNIIKEVKDSVSIPVIGNGDIKSYEDAKRMMKDTNCDAVMIGRGVLGNPWLIKEIINNKKEVITIEDRLKMCLKHFEYLLQIKSEKVALLEMRTHAVWYIKGVPNSNLLKRKIYDIKTKNEFNDLIYNYLHNL